MIGLSHKITPDWTKKKSKNDFPFFKDVFYDDINKLHRTNSNEFATLKYYGTTQEQISFHDYIKILHKLNTTDYPTLYGTANEQEYFAEYFYLYFHCLIQEKPYQVTVTKNNNAEEIINNPLSNERCSNRLFLLKNALLKVNDGT